MRKDNLFCIPKREFLHLIAFVTFVGIMVIWWLVSVQLNFNSRTVQKLDNSSVTVEYPIGLPYEPNEPQKVVLRRDTTGNITSTLTVQVDLRGGITLSPTVTYIGDTFNIIFPPPSLGTRVQEKEFFIKNDHHAVGTLSSGSVQGKLFFTDISTVSPKPISVPVIVETAWRHTWYQFLTNDIKKNSPIIILIGALILMVKWYWDKQEANAEKEKEDAIETIKNAKSALQRGNIEALADFDFNKIKAVIGTTKNFEHLQRIHSAVNDKNTKELCREVSDESWLTEYMEALLYVVEQSGLNTLEKIHYLQKFLNNNTQLSDSNKDKINQEADKLESFLPKKFDVQKIWKTAIGEYSDASTPQPNAEYEREFLYKEQHFWKQHPVYEKLENNYPVIIIGKPGSGKTALAMGLTYYQDYSFPGKNVTYNTFPIYIAEQFSIKGIHKQISMMFVKFIVKNAVFVSGWNYEGQKSFIKQVNTHVPIEWLGNLLQVELTQKRKKITKNKTKTVIPVDTPYTREEAEKFYLEQLKNALVAVKRGSQTHFEEYEWLNNFDWLLYELDFFNIFLMIDIPASVPAQTIRQILDMIPVWRMHKIVVKLFVREEAIQSENYKHLPVEYLEWTEENLKNMMNARGFQLGARIEELDFSRYTTPAEVVQAGRKKT